MGGSGGDRYFIDRTPDEVKSDLRKEEERTQDQAFDTETAEALGNLLAEANTRDTGAISEALHEIKRVLEHDIEGSVDPRFGGSVRKHTFVDGLSDVDTLLILRDPSLKNKSPEKVLDHFERKLRKELAGWDFEKQDLRPLSQRQPRNVFHRPGVLLGRGERPFCFGRPAQGRLDSRAWPAGVVESRRESGQ